MQQDISELLSLMKRIRLEKGYSTRYLAQILIADQHSIISWENSINIPQPGQGGRGRSAGSVVSRCSPWPGVYLVAATSG
jgi:DNA-binding XRE family transcriptional regulator